MTDSHNVVHSLERASHMHSDHNTEKIMENQKLQEKVPSKVKNREIDDTFEPDGQKDMLI